MERPCQVLTFVFFELLPLVRIDAPHGKWEKRSQRLKRSFARRLITLISEGWLPHSRHSSGATSHWTRGLVTAQRLSRVLLFVATSTADFLSPLK